LTIRNTSGSGKRMRTIIFFRESKTEEIYENSTFDNGAGTGALPGESVHFL
jgi:hypothetical protein